MDFELQPFDQIFVRENPDFEDVKNVVLTGEVKYPGTYTLLSKDEKISSVIKRAGGLTDYAFLDGVKMFRLLPTEEVGYNNNNIVISEKLKDSLLTNPDLAILYKQELLTAREQDLEQRFSSSILEYNLVYLNMYKALNANSSKHNLVLLVNDSIIIPRTMDVVHISGKLKNLKGNSISAPYFNRKRANYYVNNFAGGFTNENKKSNTVVVYPNGITKKSINFGLFTISPRIKKGSTILVAEKTEKVKNKNKKPIDWNEAIENTMLKVSAILTLWLLIERVTPQ
jgi:hypothetical protein